MTDRFKFRVWNKQSSSYIKEEKFYIDKFGSLFKYEKSKGTVYINSDNPYIMCLCSDRYTCEQCTGLKDKNGKLIYENDLLKDNNGIWQVKWNNEEGAFYIWNKKRDFYLSPFIGKYEIIGNINENPELLEEKAE